MQKPRNKNNPRKRLRSALRGSKIIFDGNSSNTLEYRQANGLRMDRNMVDVATGWAWQWRITLGLRCRFGSEIRLPSSELIIDQPCRINELTEYVKTQHAIMSLEQPGAWVVEAQTWQIEIMG